VPAKHIFPPLPFPWWNFRTRVTVADDWDEKPSEDLYYLKQPWVNDEGTGPGEDDDDSSPAKWLAHEVEQLEQLEQLASHPPHPNLVRYHGCRVRKGCVTRILLGRVPGPHLWYHLMAGGTVDKDAFLGALASAVDYFHNVVGLVHNDIRYDNIMVGPDGAPTLINLGSTYPVGEEMLTNVPYVVFFLLSSSLSVHLSLPRFS
jgi:hypothetical protein